MKKRDQHIEQILESFQAIKQHMIEGFSFAKDSPITPTQGFVLHFVAKYKQSNVKEIAKRLFITSSAATQLIEGLVKNGFLKREEDTKDRRSVTLTLTEKAIKQVNANKEKRLEKMNEIFNALSDSELATYLKLNQKISTTLTK